jgi:inorganic pyrophosphatase
MGCIEMADTELQAEIGLVKDKIDALASQIENIRHWTNPTAREILENAIGDLEMVKGWLDRAYDYV